MNTQLPPLPPRDTDSGRRSVEGERRVPAATAPQQAGLAQASLQSALPRGRPPVALLATACPASWC